MRARRWVLGARTPERACDPMAEKDQLGSRTSRSSAAHLDMPDVHLAIVGSCSEVGTKPWREGDGVDKVGMASEGVQTSAAIDVPKTRGRVEGGPARYTENQR